MRKCLETISRKGRYMGDGGSHEGLYKQGFNNNYGTVHGIIGLQISNINLYIHILMEI